MKRFNYTSHSLKVINYFFWEICLTFEGRVKEWFPSCQKIEKDFLTESYSKKSGSKFWGEMKRFNNASQSLKVISYSFGGFALHLKIRQMGSSFIFKN